MKIYCAQAVLFSSLFICAFFQMNVSAATIAPVIISTPAGGEFFVVGSQQRMRLDPKTRSKSVLIELSIDSGTTFTTLGAIDNTVTDKTKRNNLVFTVPNTPSGLCVIRAKSIEGGVGLSSGFSIGAANTVAGQVGSGAASNGAVLTADGSGGSGFTSLDGKFVKVAGDTMTGALTVASKVTVSDPTSSTLSIAGPAAQYDFKSDANGLTLTQQIQSSGITLFVSNPTTNNFSLAPTGNLFLGGTVFLSGALNYKSVTLTTQTTFTANSTTCVFFCNTTSNSTTITLPDPAVVGGGRVYIIKKIAAANSVIITPTAGTIEGAANITLTTNSSFRVVMSNGTNWFVIGQ